jgi:hypothetical protein
MQWKPSLLVLLLLAIGLGVLIAYADSRPNWDDTGITAGVIFVICAVLATLRPDWAWLWALLVGVWIPLLGIPHQNYASALALAVAFLGAYSGVLLRKLVFSL